MKTENDEGFISKVARTIDEARQLIDVEFEYVSEIKDARIFRKRK